MNEYLQFVTNHPLLVTAAVLLTVLVIANELRLRAGGSSQLPPGLAVQLINRDAIVLDIRPPEQYAGGHIIKSRNVPQGELEAWGKKMKKLSKKPIITVDDTGMQAAKAATELRKLEFSTVFSLAGGLAAWRGENLPLETGQKSPQVKKSSKKKRGSGQPDGDNG